MLLNENFLREEARKMNSQFAHSDIIRENTYLSEHYDSAEEKSYDIFLSHSSLDHDLVLTLVHLFNQAGYSVYVDWIEDQQLERNNVTKSTAAVLKKRMKQSRCLAYVSTRNITTSKWCPWELGYFDGKSDEQCCILPIMMGNRFDGQEYLGLYPYLKYAINKRTNKYDFWVHEQDSEKYILLSLWLSGGKPYIH